MHIFRKQYLRNLKRKYKEELRAVPKQMRDMRWMIRDMDVRMERIERCVLKLADQAQAK